MLGLVAALLRRCADSAVGDLFVGQGEHNNTDRDRNEQTDYTGKCAGHIEGDKDQIQNPNTAPLSQRLETVS